LVTYYLLFVMELATRRVHCAGISPNPDEIWMKQVARNVTAMDGGFLAGKRYLLMDRDSKFSAAFRQVLSDAGTEPVRLPPQSPNLNAHMERFWRSLREECTDRMIFFGETMLRSAVREFVLHFHGERNHQGLENRVIGWSPSPLPGNGRPKSASVPRTSSWSRAGRSWRRSHG
jgi:transposase InsO family protein